MVVAGRELGARHEVVVVRGGGFGGLQAARALREGPVAVTLIDRRSFHGMGHEKWRAIAPDVKSVERALDVRGRQGTIVTAEPNAVPSAGCTAMCR